MTKPFETLKLKLMNETLKDFRPKTNFSQSISDICPLEDEARASYSLVLNRRLVLSSSSFVDVWPYAPTKLENIWTSQYTKVETPMDSQTDGAGDLLTSTP